MLNPKQYLGSYRLQAKDESLPSLYPKILAELGSCSTCILVHAAAGKNGPFPEAIKHQVWGRSMQDACRNRNGFTNVLWQSRFSINHATT